MSTPLVSVCLITYNHAKYIRDAIEGVLAQKVNFPIELIIADDFSTDGTRNILTEYKQKYPDLIRLILQEKNVGPHQNWMDLMQSPDSKYIAYFEGDDYWIDDSKLQKQTEFLENHEDTGMVCTNYRKYFFRTGAVKHKSFSNKKYNNEVRFEDYLLDMSSIATATILIRKKIVQDYFDEITPETRESFIVGDTPLWLFAAAKSGISVFPDETAVYRILNDSACHFNTPEEHYEFVLKGFKIADYFYNRYGKNDETLYRNLNQKKIKAALFHGYRTLNRDLALRSYKELMSYNSGYKKKISALLMLAGSFNKSLNRMTGMIMKSGNRNLNIT
jgi:glycosyltransferase involved in cell wall biosynthesis